MKHISHLKNYGLHDFSKMRYLEIKKSLMSRIPMNKLGNGEDVSNSVAFLASDAASYITGETIHVNGGMYMA